MNDSTLHRKSDYKSQNIENIGLHRLSATVRPICRLSMEWQYICFYCLKFNIIYFLVRFFFKIRDYRQPWR